MNGHLTTALARFEAAIASLTHRLPAEPPTVRMVRELSAAEAAPRQPDPDMLEGVRRRLGQALANGRLGDVDRKDLKRAPWVLWQGEPPAIRFPGLLDLVVGQAMRSPRALRYLIEAWLRDFSPERPGMASAGLAIQRLLTDSKDTRLELWRSAQSRFRLFDAAEGPGTLAGTILNGTQPIATVLEAAGFSDQARAVSGYLGEVQTEVLGRVPAALRGPKAREQLGRIFTFLLNGRQLRFDDAHIAIARALCKPWLETDRQPAMELQQTVKAFLVEQVGNPQLRPGRWVGAEPEAALIRRWLARASLQVFFGLIKDYALDAHWTYREAFWSACLRRGAIDDAWLVLGANVHASARAREGLGTAYGQLVGGGISGDQSVLLLRIGPLTIAEWSHNGKLRAWPVDRGPRLGQSVYSRSDLVRQCLPFPADPTRAWQQDNSTSGLTHVGSASGVWQRRAAALLARHASIALTPPEWQPR